MRIVQVASEFSPLVRVGSLADSVTGLTRALARRGHQVGVFLPAYRQVMEHPLVRAAQPLFDHTLEMGDGMFTAQTLQVPLEENITLFLVKRDESFDRSFPYGPPGGEYEDSDTRFIVFNKVVVDALLRLDLPWDVLQCHDWPAAMVPVFLRVEERRRALSVVSRTVLTIHHASFQGVYPRRSFALTNLPAEFYAQDGLEFYGQVNFLKGGILFSDYITTTSPQYAKEMLKPEFSFGLDGVMNTRRRDLRGITGGIETDLWNPATDPLLPAFFSPTDPQGKRQCRTGLLTRVGLDDNLPGPFVAMETSLIETNELPLPDMRDTKLIPEGGFLVVLANGPVDRVKHWRRLGDLQRGRLIVLENPDAHTVHQVLGGADFFLVPERVEPSPFKALRAMRYGTVPIVSATGGLLDVVVDETKRPGHGNGIIFERSEAGVRDGLARASELFSRRDAFGAVRQRGLGMSVTWDDAATSYETLYRELL